MAGVISLILSIIDIKSDVTRTESHWTKESYEEVLPKENKNCSRDIGFFALRWFNKQLLEEELLE